MTTSNDLCQLLLLLLKVHLVLQLQLLLLLLLSQLVLELHLLLQVKLHL